MKKLATLLILSITFAFIFLFLVGTVQAQITVYTATLSGPAEAPPNASPGTGSATITINATLNTMRVQCTFSGYIDQNNTLDITNAYNVAVNVNTDNTAILDEFTVSGGYYGADPGLPSRVARGSTMYNNSSSPTIRNCIFSKDVGFYGNT
jgi:hypothetical protein